MKITLKLYATLGKYLPDGAHKNQVDMTLADNVTIGQVIDHVKLPPTHCHLVLVNGIYVAPDERDGHTLKDGDALAIWPPVAGG